MYLTYRKRNYGSTFGPSGLASLLLLNAPEPPENVMVQQTVHK